MNKDKLIFSELKNTISAEQNNLVNSLDVLKSQVSHFFGEDSNDKISHLQVNNSENQEYNFRNTDNSNNIMMMPDIHRIKRLP